MGEMVFIKCLHGVVASLVKIRKKCFIEGYRLVLIV